MISRRAYKYVAALCFMVIAGLVTYCNLANSQLTYNGRSIKFWLWQYSCNYMGSTASSVRARSEAEAAVRKIGTNALPTLIAMTKGRDSRLLRWLTALSRKQSLLTFDLYTKEERQYMVVHGFEILGESASPAVDSLKQLLSTSEDKEIQIVVASELGAIGPEARSAVPILLKLLDGNDDVVKADSLGAIYYIGQEPDLVIPEMIRHLKATNWQPANRQVMLSMILLNLGSFKERSRRSVPLILPLLKDDNAQIRKQATNALMAIAPNDFQSSSHWN